MLTVGFVLFVLTRYHSPLLAGAATFLLLVPGLLLSPVAGALLDRYGRARLISLDFLVMAAMLTLMAGLSAMRALSPSVLLLLCGLASLTGPLSAAGVRSLFPVLVPGTLWERANALDSSTFVLATVIGAPLAGVLVAFAGGEWALVVTAALFACAGVAIVGLRDPGPKLKPGGILQDSWAGLAYVLRNRTLAGLAVTFFAFNVAWGCLIIAIPVLVLGRFHQGPATVGYLWGAMGVAGFAATLVAGRLKTRGRERGLMAGSILAMALGMAFLPFASSVFVVALALVAIALIEAPFDIAFLTLRQRRSDPAKLGRVFAVSMSLNVVGIPVGTALGGALVVWSVTGAEWVAVALTATAAIFPLLIIPAKDER